MQEQFEEIKFKNREEYKNFLIQTLSKMNEKGTFNIYAHQISNCGSDWFNYEIEYKKIQILSNSLTHINRYGSINGTMRLLGCTCNNLNEIAEKLINYNYDKLYDSNVCIVAIPKYIEVNYNGEKKMIEYSSYKGKAGSTELRNDKELLDVFREITHNSMPDGDHFKCCFYDAIKNDKNLPKEYLLGIQGINAKEEKYSFTPTHTHLSEIDDKTVEKHNLSTEFEILKLYEKYGTDDPKVIFAKSSVEYLDNYICKSYDYDFDFD